MRTSLVQSPRFLNASHCYRCRHSPLRSLLPELQLCALHCGSPWGHGSEQHVGPTAYMLEAQTVMRQDKPVHWHREGKKAGRWGAAGGT